MDIDATTVIDALAAQIGEQAKTIAILRAQLTQLQHQVAVQAQATAEAEG